MTYDAKRASFDKEHIYVVEIDLDYCSLDFGEGYCLGGERSITTDTVSDLAFATGDRIEGQTSGAVGYITDITGTAPNYTIKYRRTSSNDFSSSSETIENLDGSGLATKNGDSPILATAGDDKCYNTAANCQSIQSYTTKGDTGLTTINAVGVDFTFYYERASGSFIEDGFRAGDTVFPSGFGTGSYSAARTITFVEDTKLYATGGVVFDSTGSGDERLFTAPQKTYRFCLPRSPHPIGIDAIPSLKSVSITPSKIDVAGGMGERSSVSLTFNDHPHNDIGIDKYTGDRSYIATDRGTFWTKFRARNPNYQFRNLRLLSGYLEDGKFIADNFKTRNYVIEKMDVTGGTCSIKAQDPLKKASAKKAQVPEPSNGIISNSGGISDSATSITLSPSGIGSEYPASGYVTLSGSEIASYTLSGDVMTIVRAQFNTVATSHEEDAVVQYCYYQEAEVNAIAEDVLVNYAKIDAGFINSTEWQTEVDTHLNGNLKGIIPAPTDVEKILKELSEAKPHFIYWDEINQKINFTALKAPPESANVIDMDSGIVKDSFKTKDMPDMRASTVYYVFGQLDPTKGMDDLSNFTQTIVRSDSSSIAKYQSNQIKKVVSRWIPSTSKPIAENAAQLLGRRFSDIPREVKFSLEAKDNSLNIGDTRALNHRDIVDASGAPANTIFQIISSKESENYDYVGIEYRFGQVLAGDNDIDTDTIKISINERNLNLYDRYVAYFGSAPTGSTEAVFEVESGVIVGSDDTASHALEVGVWPVGAVVTLVNKGYIVGKGGDAGKNAVLQFDGGGGGPAMSIDYDLTLLNFGIIGGGGGGGAYNIEDQSVDPVQGEYFGGGGAGDDYGRRYLQGGNGSLLAGGVGYRNSTAFFPAADGGGLGQNGEGIPANSVFTITSYGGSAGKAIDLNGNTVTYIEEGDIRGAVS